VKRQTLIPVETSNSSTGVVQNDPMAKEADHLQIMALATWFGIPTAVAYLDASVSTTTATIHKFPEDAVTAPIVHLLYRPGHYDVLVPRAAAASSVSD
jgi:hypothetical protein